MPLGIIFTGAGLWPFFEQWATGDKSIHNINDRPRNAPVRTGVGVAAVLFYGVLWAEGANDVLADRFDVPLYTITWISRFAVFILPIGGYYITKRICLGLQRKDAGLLTHGVEIGIIHQLPNGEFVEEERPLTEEERAVVDSKHVFKALPTPVEADENGVPAPAARGPLGWAQGVRQPGLHRDRGAHQRPRSRQRPRPGRPRGDRGRRARRDRRRRRRLPRGALTRPTARQGSSAPAPDSSGPGALCCPIKSKSVISNGPWSTSTPHRSRASAAQRLPPRSNQIHGVSGRYHPGTAAMEFAG